MDITPKDAQEIEEIERQLDPTHKSGPYFISQEEIAPNRSIIKQMLAALGILVGGSALVVLILLIPTKKKTSVQSQVVTQTEVIQVASQPVVVQTIYANPFDAKTQYSNPFDNSKNPFNNVTQ